MGENKIMEVFLRFCDLLYAEIVTKVDLSQTGHVKDFRHIMLNLCSSIRLAYVWDYLKNSHI